jgi:hypothetical protein
MLFSEGILMASNNRKRVSSEAPKTGRHQSRCTICSHPQRQEIEDAFISWTSPAQIVTTYNLRDRTAIYRHAHATGLMAKRERNVKAALGRIIERVDEVKPTAAAVIQAIALLARINTRGELVEPGELVWMNEQFSKMNFDEMAAYAQSGILPAWFVRPAAAKSPEGSGEGGNA